MIFVESPIDGALVVELDRRSDDRGFFARAWCEEEFAAHGLNARFVQANVAFSERSGTLRGLHYQLAPHEEEKLIRCTRGAIYDVIVDLRPESPTFEQWAAVELTAENGRMVHVPAGCAHGYQTLVGRSEVFYLVSYPYTPAAEAGIRYDDPAFDVAWPLEVRELSPKDRAWPDYVGPRVGSS